MAKTKTIADETVISALLTCATLDAAARQCGLSVRQLYERRRNPAFVCKLREAQSSALAGATRFLQKHTATAAETLVDICKNGSQEQNRLNAARVLMEQACRLTETVDVLERLETLEQLSNGGDNS